MTRLHRIGLYIAELAADRLRLERDLREAFPALRFVLAPDFPADQSPEIVFLESTATDPIARGRSTEAWILPDGWTPAWGPGPFSSMITCLNRPRFRVSFMAVQEPIKATAWRVASRAANQRVRVPIEYINDGVIQSSWEGEDPERLHFIRKVVRLAKRGATNALLGIDLDTGRPRHPPVKGGPLWVAEQAAAWLRERPDRFLRDDIRLADEYETYRWPLPTETE